MQLTFLGTGTSTGVPQIGCQCRTCQSLNPRDKRMRSSVLLSPEGKDENLKRNLLIDCGSDFYHQMLRAGSPPIDALLLTHIHYDHVGGLDDLRPYCKGDRKFPIYCTKDLEKDLRKRLPYCFKRHPYPGVPQFEFHRIRPFKPFEVLGLECTPLPIMHYKLPIVGYKFERFAYITDCKTMPDSTKDALKGIDTLVINALRIEPHLSHLSLSESLELIAEIKPKRAFLTHLSHQMGLHDEVSKLLPENVFIAYDRLKITV